MAAPTLPDLERETPFSADDRVMHATKYAERSFGAPISDIGTVEARDIGAVVIVTVNDKAHELRWARQPNGSILWFADGDPRPLPGGPTNRALAAVRNALAERS